jgi:hypothetical protein
MITSSAKAKGRRLQDWVKSKLISKLGLEKDTDLIRTAIMGESGADVTLISSLRPRFPFSIECKNQEKYKGIYDTIEQARGHGKQPPIVFLKMNHKPTLVVLEAEQYLEDYFAK